MTQSWWIACALVCGCGRIGFEEAQPGGTLLVSYPASDLDAVLGATAIQLEPTIHGGPATFRVEPALPAGLSLDPGTGVLSGTPAEIADGVTYKITATGARGAVHAELRLTALPGYVVDVTGDLPDDDGRDEVCRSTAAGGCTLRAAFQTALARSTKQLILIGAGSYPLDSPLGGILTNDLVIVGRSASGTTIHPATVHPGCGLVSIESGRKLVLKKATFRDFGPADGAVVHVKDGSLEVDAASFANNLSAGAGGVIFAGAGASVVLARSTFTGNGSLDGSGWGGVIHGEGVGASIVVRQCAASENTAVWGSFSHIMEGTTLTLESSTLYRNTSKTAGTLASPGGTYVLVNDTIVHNTNTNPEPSTAGLYLYSAPAAYMVANTILAFNRDVTGREDNCDHRTTDTRIASMGGNIVSDGAGNCAAELVGPRDRLATDPGIEPNGPGDHGGPTRTFLLTEGSVAIDGTENGRCPLEDQRGFRRRDAPEHCDVGAVEIE